MNEILSMILYVLGSILIIVLIILSIKLIITMNKIENVVDDISDKVDSFNNAKGLKFAIAAKAIANSKESSIVYEAANRTVLKFRINGNYSAQEGNSYASISLTTPKDNESLTFGDLKVWVIGGDAPSGTNSLDPFPLSWGDNKNFKLMQEDRTNKNNSNSYYGDFWWVTWEITAETYHGFVIGDVPTDVTEKGPSVWYAAECAWVPNKSDYILRPGETLQMGILSNGSYANDSIFLFRLKNKGTR